MNKLLIFLTVICTFGAPSWTSDPLSTRATLTNPTNTTRVYAIHLTNAAFSTYQMELSWTNLVKINQGVLPPGAGITINSENNRIPFRLNAATLDNSPFQVITGFTNAVGFNRTNKFIQEVPGLAGLVFGTSVGRDALNNYSAASANSPTAFGQEAARDTTTGDIVAIGLAAGRNNTSGTFHTYVGTGAGQTGTTGQGNTAVGYGALRSNISTNSYSVAIGYSAAEHIRGVRKSVVIGSRLGGLIGERTDKEYEDVIVIGYREPALTNNTQITTNAILIGSNLYPDASNVIIIGNTNQTSARFLIASNDGSTNKFLAASGTYLTAGGGSPGGSSLQLQFNNSGSFDGAAGITTDASETNLVVSGLTTSTNGFKGAFFEGTGTTADSYLLLPDDDASHKLTVQANNTTTTDINLIFPAAPISGLLKSTISGTTNMTLSAAVAGTDYSVGTVGTLINPVPTASVDGQIPQFDGTTGTNVIPSVDNLIMFNGTQASRTLTASLSGATDPVFTFLDNQISVNVPFVVSSGGVEIATTLKMGGGSGSYFYRTADGSFIMANNAINDFGLLQFGGTSSSYPALKRSGTGLQVKLADDSALSGFTAGTLTLTPAAANTTAVTMNGYSVTGSGATTGIDLSGTWNTSGNPIFNRVNITNTASGTTAKFQTWEISGTEQAGIGKGGQIYTVNGITAGSGASMGNAAIGQISVLSSSTSKAVMLSTGFDTFNTGVLAWSSTSAANGSKDLKIGRDSAATLQMGDDAASPVNQTFKAHDGSGTDIAGADLAIKGGQGTGTGRGGDVSIETAPSGSTGSSANAYSKRAAWIPKAVTLTSATATTVATIAVPAAKFVGGECIVTVFASDATDHQARTLRFNFSAVNKAGTVTAAIDTPDEAIAVSAGTLTATITAVANGNAVDLKVNANSSLSETTLSATVSLPAINSNDTAAITEI